MKLTREARQCNVRPHDGGPLLAIAAAEGAAPQPSEGVAFGRRAGGLWRGGGRTATAAIPAGPVVGLIGQALLLTALAAGVGLSRAGWLVGIACGVLVNGVLTRELCRHAARRLNPADWVTLARATLAVGVAALVATAFDERAPLTTLVSLTTLALALDAVDGWIARRTKSATPLGAQLDGEVDAFLMLVLSVYVARAAGTWVLAIGAARYAFLLAGWVQPWMRAKLPRRYWRKVVTATQGIVLTVAAADVVPLRVSTGALLASLALLTESFGRDVLWLWRRRHTAGGPARRAPRRRRTAPGAVLSILALALVWGALVAPDRPSALTPLGFVRLPVEGLGLVALAILLPATPRRLLAAIAGVGLGLLVIVKILDIGFLTAFDRPFDPVGDPSYAGIGIETMRAALGRTQADLVVGGVAVLTLALLGLTTLSALRLARVAASHRRRSLGALAALGAIWLACSASAAQFVSHTPIASVSAADLVVHEVRTVRADFHDKAIFAGQIRRDPYRNTPGKQLLTALRGKDVLLVFVESYGRVTVQGSSFSPGIDALLDQRSAGLRAAGFSARSAFVTSSTFGGISWLAHSTLQAGVSANSQRRYDQLVTSDRFTLSDAFKKAGWRTIDDAPADDRVWPEGSSFYHYDKLYDRRDVGYRGPTFTYAPMPDQYVFSSLQRLELAKRHRRPVFAEVDTVSSHMPWNRIPQMIDWGKVGDGSVFNHTPLDHETGAFWSNPKRVKAAYARSIRYSLNTLISFVQRFGRKNLVLVVVGDEQPLPIVSGQTASHDVPISIIAHDPKVLGDIGAWGWDDGLRPAPAAPVWPMSAFRDRFLRAFGSTPASTRAS